MKNEYWYHKFDLGETPGVYRMSDYIDNYPLPKDMSGMKVLDLASAEGYFSFEMEKRGADVIAIELNDICIKHHNLIKDYFGYKTKVLKMDILDSLSMGELGKFDFIMLSNILQHIKKEEKGALLTQLKVMFKKTLIIATSEKSDIDLLKEVFKDVSVSSTFIMSGYKPRTKTYHNPEITIIEIKKMRQLIEEKLREIIKEDNTMIDVGASYGKSTMLFSELVGKTGKIFSFEPDIESCERLKLNLDNKGMDNVEIINKAISDKDEILAYYSYERNKEDNRYYHTYKTDLSEKIREVQAVSLDNYFKDFDKQIDFVKLDMQGGEGYALQGMVKLIKKNPKMKIMTAFWNIGITNSGFGGKEFLELINSLGFKILEADREQRIMVEIENIGILLDKYPLKEKSRANLTHLFLQR